MFARANFYQNGWYTRFVTRDGAGNVIGCTDGGDAWIWDNVSGSLTNANGSPFRRASARPQNGQLPGFSGKLNRGMSNGKANYNAIYITAEKPFTDQSTWGFTPALTLQRARSNVAQELNSDEFYNGTALDAYGWNHVNGVPKWNWVTSANYRAPFGIVLSGMLTLNSGPAFGHIHAPWNSSINCPIAGRRLCCFGQHGRRLLPEEGHRLQAARPSRCEDVQDALGPRADGRLRGVQRVQLAEPQLLRHGVPAAATTRRGLENSQVANDARAVPGGTALQVLIEYRIGRGRHRLPPFLIRGWRGS